MSKHVFHSYLAYSCGFSFRESCKQVQINWSFQIGYTLLFEGRKEITAWMLTRQLLQAFVASYLPSSICLYMGHRCPFRNRLGQPPPFFFFCSLWRMLGKERSWFSRKITCPYCGAHPSTFMLDYCCKEWQKSFFFHNPRVSWMSELFSTVEALNYIYVLKCFCLAGMHQHWENQNQKWKKGHVVVYFLFLLGFTWVAWHHFLPSLSPRLYCTDYSTVTIYCYMYVSGLFFQLSLKKLDQLVSGVALFE